MSLQVTGMAELLAAVERIPARVEEATAAGMRTGTTMAVDEARRLLNLKSHPRHTPTPSAPGEPPARISGTLSGSVRADGPRGGGGVWVAEVQSDLAYSMIQEKGGVAGRGHRSHLPPRPYFRPMLETAGPRFIDAMAEAWMKAITT